MPTPDESKPLIAVTGATGYVGGRIVPPLLEAGYRVRCIVREPRKLSERPWRSHHCVSVVQGDLSDVDELTGQLSGCQAAYYLIHSMKSSGRAYAQRDQDLAWNFATAARSAGVGRIIYLGGLGEMGEGLSEHLASRREVEHVLASTGVDLTVFRAAMIIGSGSASFEILRYLVERLPVMVTPSWVGTESQPVAIADVVHWLVRCLSVPETAGKTLEIGGPDVLPYRELMRIMAEELGVPARFVIPVPVLTPRLSSRWISLITPVSYRIARPLADGLRNRVVVTNDLTQRLMPHRALGVREAIQRALERVRDNAVVTRWSVAGPVPGDPEYAGGTLFTDTRSIVVRSSAEDVFSAVCRIGGGHGWYAGDLLWQIRGWMDTLAGGPGLRRGRRDPERVEFGETLDFWRVIGIEHAKSLSLLAEMKLPGTATLNFDINDNPDDADTTTLTMKARFRPRGMLGILYWYSVLPLHNIVFGGMLRGIKREAEKERLDHALPQDTQPETNGRMTYARARLWLGISGVGTMVVLATAALALGLPARLTELFDPVTPAAHLLPLLAFLLAYALLQLPFDILGGYILPKRFGRDHPAFGRFVLGLLRGVGSHTSLLLLIGAGLLFAGNWLGTPGVIVFGLLVSVLLLAVRKQLAGVFAPMRAHKDNDEPNQAHRSDVPGTAPQFQQPRFEQVESEDEGFTGGYSGIFRPRRVLLPARWIRELDRQSVSVVRERRRIAATSAAWIRGRVLALAFTWTGIALAAVLVGSERLATAEGIITFSLIFTLWSFLGLLLLPTPSRAGVVEVDRAARESGVDPESLVKAARALDQYQDRESERRAGIEVVFHPIPSVRNRFEGPLITGGRGFLDAARTAIFLSASGLGLLGRAVHCNSGRPALWVYLPSE